MFHDMIYKPVQQFQTKAQLTLKQKKLCKKYSISVMLQGQISITLDLI